MKPKNQELELCMCWFCEQYKLAEECEPVIVKGDLQPKIICSECKEKVHKGGLSKNEVLKDKLPKS